MPYTVLILRGRNRYTVKSFIRRAKRLFVLNQDRLDLGLLTPTMVDNLNTIVTFLEDEKLDERKVR